MTRALFTSRFWLDAVERAIKSFAQGTVAVWLVDQTPVLDASLGAAFLGGAATALLSLLTSVASVNVGEHGTASLVEAA